MKNMLILGFLTFITLAYAKEPIEKDSMDAAHSYRVEKPVKEHAPGRAFAGSKAKKEVPEDAKEEMPTTEDSEVRYWRYQE